MKTTISDLPQDMVEDILSKVPFTHLSKVRSTSKQWNKFSKDRIVCKAESKQHVLRFLIMDYRVFSLRLNLKRDDDDLYSDPSIKKIGKLDQFEIYRVYHCDGLVLCVTLDESKLVAWNPYLGQTRLIKLKKVMNPRSMNCFGLGYDLSRSYKILRFIGNFFENTEPRIMEYELYDFHSDSWKVLDVTPDWCVESLYPLGMPLKGNTYWIAKDRRKSGEDWGGEKEDFLLCFDFTREKFGPRLKLPFQDHLNGYVSLACVREEQLAVMVMLDLFKMEMWVTTKAEPEFVFWSKFLVFDLGTNHGVRSAILLGNFFIEEENKVAWLFDCTYVIDKDTPSPNIALHDWKRWILQ